jgi:glycosyltransferase involved in cell wall biosynthesis
MKKILLCTEFSGFSTGYGVYGRELLSRLSKHYEVAELGCYITPDDPRMSNYPWRVYPNKPSENSPDYNNYLASSSFEYGEYTFNNVLLDFKPDYVIDFRDPWAFEYQSRSPFRNFYNWLICPTVDARPQNADWMELYGNADGVLTYSEFGKKTILAQSSNINVLGVASPAASENYKPFTIEEKNQLRAFNNIPQDIYILGTVMRNQPRKLFPELFKLFKRYVKESGRRDVYLYCHTAFPDVGWNIPELLMESELSSRVIFTYKCKTCQNISVEHFSDTVKYCNKCGNFSKNIAGVNNSLTEQELNFVYNLFDVYIQYATNEGFGIPIVEAAKAGVPVMNVNYSSMEDFSQTISTIPIDVKEYVKEASTSRLLAVPCENSAIDILFDLFSLPRDYMHSSLGKACHKLSSDFYSWDKNAQVWIDAIESIPLKSKKWNDPVEILQPDPIMNVGMSPCEQAVFLINNVLKKPEFMFSNLWRRLVKDLTYRSTMPGVGLLYFNENSFKDNLKGRPFTFEDAYESMVQLRDFYNKWEQNRNESIVHRSLR